MGGGNYTLIILGIILLNFFGAYWLSYQNGRKRKGILTLTILLNLMILFFFKYFNMVIAMIETILSIHENGRQSSFWADLFSMQGTGALHIAKIALPIGISFFIFQAMSYVVDVYRGTCRLQTNLLDFALYVSLFPQLIAGPIVQYSDIEEQLKSRTESKEDFLYGVKRFCYGLGKKVLIANTLGSVADQIWALETDRLGVGLAWLGIIAYAFQLYNDFSGYSDMAIGMGRMLGFCWKENFDYPFTSLSVRELWRRWHISLTSWFQNYVYFPLGGSRRGLALTCRNLLVIFLLTGIWHGANYTFLVWGLLNALILIIERLFLGRLLDKNPLKILNLIYTIFFFLIVFVFFRSDNILVATQYIGCLFGFGQQSQYSILSFLSMRVILAFVFAALGSGFLQRYWKRFSRVYDLFVFQILILIASILCLTAETYNPFIYFQF